VTPFDAAASRAGSGWFDGRDVRLRILTALGFALVTLSLQRLPVLLLALAVASALALGSGLDLRVLLRRLLPLEGFLLVLVVTLPLSLPGEVWFEIGPFAASRDGFLRALTIALKANAVVLALSGLVGGVEPVGFGRALARLGVPDKLVHLLLFSLRYVGVLHQEYVRLRQAMRARAFVPRSDRHSWRVLGWLIGMLLVRSLERSRRVSLAMRCRGFQGRFYLLDQSRWGRTDTIVALAGALGLLALFAIGRLA
jgi:cobalt/nickel transport system permease protein